MPRFDILGLVLTVFNFCRSSSQLPSPHAHQRQSPHPSTDIRYTRSDTQLMYPSVKSTVASSYPYMPPIVTSASHYALQVGASASSKPKVSSPAPPHMYGKPNAGIVSGIPVSRIQEVTPTSNPLPLTAKPPLGSSVSPSPYQQVSFLYKNVESFVISLNHLCRFRNIILLIPQRSR